MEPWVNLLTNFGLATMIIMALGLAAWRVLQWLAAEVIVPLRNHFFARITSFFDRVDSALCALESNIEAMRAHLQQQTTTLKEMRELVEQNVIAIAQIRDRLAP